MGGTGLVYAWMIYFCRSDDPYALVNHPLQPQTQHLHILLAPLLVFALGGIWHRHAWPFFRRGRRQGRRSGLSLILTAAPMVMSGYLIQTAVDPAWRKAWVVLHLVTSGLWVLGYLVHQAVSFRRIAQLRRSGRRAGGDLGPAVEDPQRRPLAVAHQPQDGRPRPQ